MNRQFLQCPQLNKYNELCVIITRSYQFVFKLTDLIEIHLTTGLNCYIITY